ncbi:MAG: putative Ig domain-containing protein [Hyphomicrobiaceae bacterium]
MPTRVDAGGGNDTITSSGDNNDTIDGGTGDDTMAGGGGDDHYYVDSAGDIVIEGENAGLDTVIASVDYTLGANVENLTLASLAIAGTGNGLANRLVGNSEANILVGLDGDDTLYGGTGDDILIGGEGSDTYTWVRGDGNDTIVDTGTGEHDIDTLYLFQDVSPEDLSAIRLTSHSDDLVLLVRGGGRITLADAFTGAGIPIEQISFETGIVWTTAEISALAQSAAFSDSPPPAAHDDEGLVYGGIDNLLRAEALLANDTDPAGEPLAIQTVSDVSIGSAMVMSDGNIALDLPAGYEGQVRFRYTVANVSGATASALAIVTIVANSAPVLADTLVDQNINAGDPWSFALPSGLFTDADGDTLAYFATLADGSELPSWLTFNRVSSTFTGTPPDGTTGPLAIRIEAYDGFVVSDTTFTINIAGAHPDPDQTFVGTSGGDVFTGGSGNDTFKIIGNNSGFDVFVGGAGTDTILGSAWNDTLGLADVAGNLDGIEVIDMGGGYDKILLTSGEDHLDLTGIAVSGVELIDAGAGNDIIVGSAGDDVIRGNAGDDVISGGDGNDTFTILGNPEGFDVFIGGAGTDTILGSAWNDTLGLANVAGNLDGIEVIDMGGGYDKILLTSGEDHLDLTGIAVSGVELIDAGAGNDIIVGSAGDDVIRGNAGDDVISGGDGNDTFTILGNPEGFDVFIGGAGTDTILGSAWNDTLGLANVAGNLDGIEVIDMGGGYDKILLTSGDDHLDLAGIAVSGVELIDAGAGNDIIVASAADDILKGGFGNDTFAFRGDFGHDTIVDFETGTAAAHDLIDMADAGFANFSALLAAASEVNGDTVITLDAAQSLTLAGVSLQHLTADHFLLA